ncbi:DNA-binding protein [Motiliproteus sp.]|uniref:DNA-binding protein n=1 Tax=Motiliproteus sp. TaxID=1898955 RepID=UPI003BABCB7D
MKSDTYSLVFEAADALLAEGVRPTQQGVRERLGKGSLSTINKALNDWWQMLGQRLQQGRHYPDLPEPLADAMEQWWRQAVESARKEFELQQDRQQRATKALNQQQSEQRQQLQDQLSQALDKLAAEVSNSGELQQQLRERDKELHQLERRVLDAEQRSRELQQEAQVQQAVIDKLEATNEGLRRQQASAGSEQRALQQENKQLRLLVEQLDRKYADQRPQ